MRFDERLFQLRELRRLSQDELGDAIGKSGPTIHRWEKGSSGPTIQEAVRLAEVLGVSLNQLAYEHPPETAPEINEDERAIVDLFRALRIDRHEALRRLSKRETIRRLAGRPSPSDSERDMPFGIEIEEIVPDDDDTGKNSGRSGAG